MKTHINLVIPLILVLSLFSGGSRKETRNGDGTLKGIVYEQYTSNPLSGASIVLIGTPLGTISNSAGVYLLGTSLPGPTMFVRRWQDMRV